MNEASDRALRASNTHLRAGLPPPAGAWLRAFPACWWKRAAPAERPRSARRPVRPFPKKAASYGADDRRRTRRPGARVCTMPGRQRGPLTGSGACSTAARGGADAAPGRCRCGCPACRLGLPATRRDTYDGTGRSLARGSRSRPASALKAEAGGARRLGRSRAGERPSHRARAGARRTGQPGRPLARRCIASTAGPRRRRRARRRR